MPRKNKEKIKTVKLPHVDVLILHGKNLQLVDYLISLLDSIGIKASNVLNLPSGKMPQERKVTYYLKDCGLAIVLVSFDEDDPDSSTSRPNVYDEIARCRTLRRNDTLVLQESRDSKLVELPSNVLGQLVVIQYQDNKFHLAIPKILNEIRSRGLISSVHSSESTAEAGSILNVFLDKMDDLWDQQFDIAWKKIHRKDYVAERSFAEALDLFFQQYHSVFDALIRKKSRGNALREICDSAYEKSLSIAVRAWEYVADAKMAKVDEAMEKSSHALKCDSLYEQAVDNLRNAKRDGVITKKYEMFASVVDLADECLKKLRK